MRLNFLALKDFFRIRPKRLLEPLFLLQPNFRGAITYLPGHYYSPLLDIKRFGPLEADPPFDGADLWEHVEMRADEQRSFYADLLQNFPPLPFPNEMAKGHRYFLNNTFFGLSDSFVLSAIIRKERPRRIIEVGSGFSTAVMLETLRESGQSAALTLIEPFPARLYSLLMPHDEDSLTILPKPIQQIELSVFDELNESDLLFIDSSHVAKVGSDVSHLILRILPRLKPGVLVHFHDIFYPFSYPAHWIREGRAWNESLFLRAFLVGNPNFQITAFNSFASYSFPELFRGQLPDFLKDAGGSIWLRKIG
jgi:hypothetical protein